MDSCQPAYYNELYVLVGLLLLSILNKIFEWIGNRDLSLLIQKVRKQGAVVDAFHA